MTASYLDKVTVLTLYPSACQQGTPLMATMALRARLGLLFVMLSNAYHYAKALQLDLAKGRRLLPQLGAGVTANSAYDVLTQYGCCEEGQYTKGPLGVPDAADDALAARHKIKMEWHAQRTVPYRQLVTDAINAGRTVVASIVVTRAFGNLPTWGTAPPPTSNNDFIGAHDVVITAYDPARDVYEFANGRGGYGPGIGYIDADYFEDIPNVIQAGGFQIIMDVDVGYVSPDYVDPGYVTPPVQPPTQPPTQGGNAMLKDQMKAAIDSLPEPPTAAQRDALGVQLAALVGKLTVATPTQPPSSGSNAASFGPLDTVTRGNWIGKYGKTSAAIACVAPEKPMPGANKHVWGSNAADVRQLLKPPSATGSGDRIASCWYADPAFTFAVEQSVVLYLLDWEGARTMRVDALEPTTQAVLATLTLNKANGFYAGVYLPVQVTGRVLLRFTKVSGANAVLSGVFSTP